MVTAALVAISLSVPLSGVLGRYLCSEILCFDLADKATTINPWPKGDGVRIDAGIYQGMSITTALANLTSS